MITGAKYPPCQFDPSVWGSPDPGACNDQGKLPDGTSCDCEKQDILAFESFGLSHEQAVKLMCVLTETEHGVPDNWRGPLDALRDFNYNGSVDPAYVSFVSKWFEDNPTIVQDCVGSSWLHEFL